MPTISNITEPKVSLAFQCARVTLRSCGARGRTSGRCGALEVPSGLSQQMASVHDGCLCRSLLSAGKLSNAPLQFLVWLCGICLLPLWFMIAVDFGNSVCVATRSTLTSKPPVNKGSSHGECLVLGTVGLEGVDRCHAYQGVHDCCI